MRVCGTRQSVDPHGYVSQFPDVWGMSGARGHVPNGHLVARPRARHVSAVNVYAVVDDALSPNFPLGVELEVVGREDAERFIEEVRGDEPEIAAKLRIEERELAGKNSLAR